MDLVINGTDALNRTLGEMPTRTSKAMVRALNRGIGAARTVLLARITKDTGLRSKDVRAALKMREASLERPVARIAADLKRIPLVKFPGVRGRLPSRGRGRSVSVRGREIPGAFMAQMKSGHRGVFKRVGKATLPILELRGPSLGRVFAKYRHEALGIGEEFFDRNFARELAFLKSKESGG